MNLNAGKLNISFYALTLFLLFLLFLQGDLAHTASSSYAYLHGYFIDFYDYNKLAVGGNDYLPTLYLIYAIWNLPLLFFGYTSELDVNPWFARQVVEILWWKIFLVIFFLATTYLISKVSKLLNPKNLNLGLIFATSPIVVLIVFSLSQYDIISVFFSILGFFYFLRREYLKFACYFSIAISIKFFALIIFIPLLLISQKKIFSILKYLIVGISVTLLEFLLYWHSNSFSERIFLIPINKIQSGLDHKFFFYFIAAIYFTTCIYLYVSKFKTIQEFRRSAVFSSLFVYSLFFFAVPWHPQWLIIIMPFLVLSHAYISNKRILLYSDFFGMLCFVWFVVNQFAFNIDSTMAYRGALRDFLPDSNLVISDLLSYKFKNLSHLGFNIYLTLPIILFFLEILSRSKNKGMLVAENLIFKRFFYGILIFILPALICIFIPTKWALKIQPLLLDRDKREVIISNSPDIKVGPIYGENFIQQNFISRKSGLSSISIKFASLDQKNSCTLFIKMLSGDKVILFKEIKLDAYNSDSQLIFKFAQPLNSYNVSYKLIVYSPSKKLTDAAYLWSSAKKTYEDGFLYYNDEIKNGDLVMTLGYNKNLFPL